MRSIYLILRRCHAAYPYVVLALFIGAFVLAFLLMFIFPPGSLGLVFLGLFGLGLMVAVRRASGAAVSWCARRLLGDGICPECGATGAAAGERCPTCNACYQPSGELRDDTVGITAVPDAD